MASFDAVLAEQEGDLMSYMNELARLNSVPGSWQLCKSTANWGQVQVLRSCGLLCCLLCPVCFCVLYAVYVTTFRAVPPSHSHLVSLLLYVLKR